MAVEFSYREGVPLGELQEAVAVWPGVIGSSTLTMSSLAWAVPQPAGRPGHRAEQDGQHHPASHVLSPARSALARMGAGSPQEWLRRRVNFQI